jgi:hypothetical protein
MPEVEDTTTSSKPAAPTANEAPFDWNLYEDTDRADIRIKSPDTLALTSLVVTLAGPQHPDRKRITLARMRRMRQAFSKTGKMPTQEPEDDESEAVDLLVACTLGWTGAPVPFSPTEARRLYTDPKRQWLREQLQAALDERERFTQRSAPR